MSSKPPSFVSDGTMGELIDSQRRAKAKLDNICKLISTIPPKKKEPDESTE